MNSPKIYFSVIIVQWSSIVSFGLLMVLTQWFSQKPVTMAGARERAGFILPPESRAWQGKKKKV